jgi:glucosylceramidase
MKQVKLSSVIVILLLGALFLQANCTKNTKPPVEETPQVTGEAVEAWLTTPDKVSLLAKQNSTIRFGAVSNSNPVIEVDSNVAFQSVDGFGYTLTGGSAFVINKLNTADKNNLLQELFGNTPGSIGVNYLRVSIGASDLSAEVFSYNDLPAGQTDVNLTSFSLSKDTVDVLPLLKQIVAINPSIKIMGSPWSAPAWMKDNGSSIGGSLQPQNYSAYAKYFVKYIQAMKANGITIDAITPQNEPQHGGNNPSMIMSAAQQADFIKNHVGPAFAAAGITTKIIIWDHNCDNPNFPITVLNDAGAKHYISGSAFHLYAGDISAMSTVKAAHPDKDVYFTEQWTSSAGNFGGDLKWHLRNVVIGSLRNWSKVVLEWNLANDGGFKPHTPGGCTQCMGALTLDGAVNRNVSYYIIAHAAKFIPPGSVRIESTLSAALATVAFKRADGKKVLIVLNDGSAAASFNIKYKGKLAAANLAAGAVATYVW